MGRTPRCPVCFQEAKTTDPSFPFCSQRCRAADLGSWLGEGYRVPVGAQGAPGEVPEADSGHPRDDVYSEALTPELAEALRRMLES